MKFQNVALQVFGLCSLFFNPAKSAQTIRHELYVGLTDCMLLNPELDCHSRHFREPFIWSTSDTSFRLSKIDTWERQDGLFGLQLTFVNALGATELSPILGATSGDNTVFPRSYTMDPNKQILHFDQYSRDTATGFRVVYADNTFIDVGPVDTGKPLYRSSLTTQFVGLRCIFEIKDHNDPTIKGVYACNAIQHKYTFQQTIPDSTQALGKFYAAYKWSTTKSDPALQESIVTSLTKNGASISFPSWFVFSLSGGTLFVDTMFSSGISKVDVGVYVLTITGTLISYNDPNTGLPWTVTQTTTITILSDCSYAQQITGSMLDMKVDLGFQYTQALVYTDNISELHGDPHYCDKTYTFKLIEPYHWIEGTPPVLVVLSSDMALDNQSRNVEITVVVVDNPQLNPRVDNFKIQFFDPCKNIVFMVNPFPLISDITITMPSATTSSVVFIDKLSKYNIDHDMNMPWCDHIAEKKAGPPALTAQNDQISINASTWALPNDVGRYSCDIEIKSVVPGVSSYRQQFKIYVICPITEIIFSPVIPDTKQYVNGLNVITSSYGSQQVNACNYPISWSTGVNPSFVNHQTSNKSYESKCQDIAKRGVYVVTTHARIKERDPITDLDWIFTAEFSFNLIILIEDCKSTVLSGSFNAMTYTLGDPASVQALTFLDSFSTFKVIPGLCGLVTVSFPPAQTFITFDGANAVVTTTDWTFVGLNSVTMTVGLVDYPEATPLVLVNNVEIFCNLNNFGFTTQPTLTEYRPGITPEPLIHEELITITCGVVPNYVLQRDSPVAYPGPGTFTQIPSDTKFQLEIVGMVKEDAGLYKYTLTAQMPNYPIASTTFEILVIDPCSETIFDTATNPVVDVVFNYGDAPQSQTPVVVTQVFLDYAIVCDFTLALTPASAFISLNPATNTITVNGASLTANDFGTHVFTLTATMTNYPAVPAASYNFNVDFFCTITSLTPIPSTKFATHSLYSVPYAATTLAMPVFNTLPAVCMLPLTYQVLDATTSLPVTEVSIADPTITIDSQDIALAGTKTYQIVANQVSTTHITGLTSSAQLDVTYQLCETNNSLLPAMLSDYTFVIMYPPINFNTVPFQDEISNFFATPGLCGAINYTISPMSVVQLTQPASNSFGPLLTIWTDDLSLAGTTQAFTITASLANYPAIPSASASFNVKLSHPCPVTILEPSTSFDDMKIVVGGPEQTVSFMQFQDTQSIQLNQPQLCGERTYTISPIVTLVQPADPWTKPWQIVLKANDLSKVGDYNVLLEATLPNYPMVAAAKKTFNVQILKPNTPPHFKEPLKESLVIQKSLESQSWKEKLPLLVDVDNQLVKLTANLGFAAQFVGVNEVTPGKEYELVVNDIASGSVVPGFYSVELTISDGEASLPFKVMLFVFEVPPVVAPPPEVVTPDEIKVETYFVPECEYSIEPPNVQQQVEYMSGSGPFMVNWNKFILERSAECTEDIEIEILLSSYWQDDRFSQESDWLQYTQDSIGNTSENNYFVVNSQPIINDPIVATIQVNAKAKAKSASFTVKVTINPTKNQTATQPKASVPVLRLNEIEYSGLAIIEVNTPIVVYDQPNDNFIKFPERYLKFTVLKNAQSDYWEDQNYIECGEVLNVKVKSFTTKEITIQLEFSNPIYISRDTFNRDQLQMMIIDESVFISAVDLITTARRRSVSQTEIFRLLGPELRGPVESMQSTAKTTNALLAGSLPLNLLLGVSLKYLWGMVNALQFVVFMDQWKVNWPPNAHVAIKTIRLVALAEFLDFNRIWDDVKNYFGFSNEESEDTIAETDETSSEKPERNLEESTPKQGVRVNRLVIFALSTLGLVAVLALLIYIAFTTNLFGNTKVFLTKIKREIMWNFFIRSYLQAILKWLFACALFFSALKLQPNFSASKGQKVFYGLMLVILVLVIPALFVYALKRHRNGLYLKEIKEKYGSLYLGQRTDTNSRIYFVIEQLVLRFVFVFITCSMYMVPGILVNTYMLLNNFNIIYMGLVEPYVEKKQLSIELANAWMLNMCAYTLLLMSDLMGTPLQEINVGWALIACIGVIFLINFGNILSINAAKIHWDLRLKYLKYKHKKDLKMREKQKQKAEEEKDKAEEGQIEIAVRIPIQEVEVKLKQLDQQFSPAQCNTHLSGIHLKSRQSFFKTNFESMGENFENNNSQKSVRESIREQSFRVDQSLARLSDLASSPKNSGSDKYDPSNKGNSLHTKSFQAPQINVDSLSDDEEEKYDGLNIIEDLEIQSAHSLTTLGGATREKKLEPQVERKSDFKNGPLPSRKVSMREFRTPREKANSIALSISQHSWSSYNQIDKIQTTDKPITGAPLRAFTMEHEETKQPITQQESLIDLSALDRIKANVMQRRQMNQPGMAGFQQPNQQQPAGLIQLHRTVADPTATDLASRMRRIEDLFKDERKKFEPSRWKQY